MPADVLARGSVPSGAATPNPDADGALNLYARVLAAQTLSSAAHALVTALAGDLQYARVSIGLHDNGRTRLLASTGMDLSNADAELAQLLTGAMDEAIEQGAAIAWPAPAAGPPDHAPWIDLEHQALQREVGGAVASVPMGRAGEALGALCVERQDAAPFTPGELARLERLLVLAAPALRWMHDSALPWHRRARRSLARAWLDLRQPQRRATRRLLVLLTLATLFLALVPLQTSVSGRARVEGAQQRVLSAPSDGFIKTAHVRPGDRVKAGAALVDLIEEDLQLERARWSSQLAQHENAYAAAMAKSDRVGASTSFARLAEAQAQLALVDEQRARGRIVAPFDALVVQGDLSQSIGAPVRQGDALLTLASTDAYRVMVQIDETDIARVHAGQPGQLVLSSLPWQTQALVVARITPLAKAVEGRNVFEVEARLSGAAGELRPGLLGRADLVVGRAPPLWAWSRHAIDRIRLAWWAWIG